MDIRKFPSERKADSHTFRREFHVEKNPAFRLAGKIFQDSSERQLKSREQRQSRQKSRPTGFGFGERHPFGPDDSWASQESLRGTHDRDHYIVGENHGFSPEVI